LSVESLWLRGFLALQAAICGFLPGRLAQAHLLPPGNTAQTARIRAEGENAAVDLQRAGWLIVVLGCLVAVAILAAQGYVGYAAVTFAVALSAAVNL
jgi:hypothetical protein